MEWNGNPSLAAGCLLSSGWVPWAGGGAGLCLPAMLWIFTVLRSELDTGQSLPRQSHVIPWQKIRWLEVGEGGGYGGNHRQCCAGKNRGICSVFYEGFCVCSCGEVNLLCARPLQQWDAASCAGGHAEAVGHPARIHVLLHQCWDLLSWDRPRTSENWANSLRGASSRCRAKELWDLSLSACTASTLLGCKFS